ncbi:interleukin-15 receptor subunit alpha isoform X3 [Ictalurus punctatus]|uniref:Interleukin-15 receptor subunit alpha isoform X3 n=1 Tax=Ictalurus punctatus TaxID=7998 RepID=A0A2D0T5J6_ICTPU|nr:interleukin-15 receptor subunit alpha isoform X3 [Ictalurus punctatus]
MRASILTFIFIISEYSIITGGYGNCGNPNVIDNAEIKTNVTVQTFRMPCKEGYVRKAGTSNFFKCKESKWINEPPLICIRDPTRPLPVATTLISTSHSPVTLSWFSPTPKTHPTTTEPESISTTTATKGITAGSIILVIIAGLAAAILFWRKRSKLRSTSHPIEMTIQNPDSDQPLIMASPITISCPPDSVQPLFTPFEDSPKGIYANVPLSA